MTDETTTATAESEAVDSDDEVPRESEGSTAGAYEVVPHEHEEAPTRVDRYIVPLLLPLVVVAGVIFFVLNLSRVFLAASAAGAVTIAVIVTLAILVGAAMISAAPRMRTSSIALVVGGGLVVILMAGSLTLGESEDHGGEEGAFPAVQPAVDVPISSGNLFFDPTDLEAETGIFSITMTNIQSGSHTFVIETPGPVTSKPNLEVASEGDVDSYGVFVGEAGDYVFYCSIPGHRAAGMEGVLAVTGDVVTIEEAAAELGPAEPGAGAEAEA